MTSYNNILGPQLSKRYKIIKMLGEGGMGKVYLAEDLELPRKVAIKSIRPEMRENAEVLKRIKRECQMHAAIGVHPHIVALYDKVEDNSNLYLIMEYVDGEPLANFFSEKKALNSHLYMTAVYEIIIQVLDALSCIHKHDIIHRDIKPSNILVQTLQKGRFQAKLMDFGIARSESDELALTQLTSLNGGGPGTPAYMAPERIDSQTFGDICPATDLYSVGVILYELLSDGPPFKGTITEIFTGHLTKSPDLNRLRPDVPPALLSVLEKSLKKQPKERYANAGEMARDIEAVKNGLHVAPQVSPSPSHTEEKTLLNTASVTPIPSSETSGTLLDTKTGQKFSLKKGRKLWVGGAVVLAVLLIFAVFGIYNFFSKETEPVIIAPPSEKPPLGSGHTSGSNISPTSGQPSGKNGMLGNETKPEPPTVPGGKTVDSPPPPIVTPNATAEKNLIYKMTQKLGSNGNGRKHDTKPGSNGNGRKLPIDSEPSHNKTDNGEVLQIKPKTKEVRRLK